MAIFGDSVPILMGVSSGGERNCEGSYTAQMQQATGLGMTGEGGEDQQIIDFLRGGEIVTVLNQPRVSGAYYRSPLTSDSESMRVVEFKYDSSRQRSRTDTGCQIIISQIIQANAIRLNSAFSRISLITRGRSTSSDRQVDQISQNLRITPINFNSIDVQRSGAN
jgi:hypothetical protein